MATSFSPEGRLISSTSTTNTPERATIDTITTPTTLEGLQQRVGYFAKGSLLRFAVLSFLQPLYHHPRGDSPAKDHNVRHDHDRIYVSKLDVSRGTTPNGEGLWGPHGSFSRGSCRFKGSPWGRAGGNQTLRPISKYETQPRSKKNPG